MIGSFLYKINILIILLFQISNKGVEIPTYPIQYIRNDYTISLFLIRVDVYENILCLSAQHSYEPCPKTLSHMYIHI